MDALDGDAVKLLLERVRLETNGLGWWWAIQEASASELASLSSAIYLTEPSAGCLRQVNRKKDGYWLGPRLFIRNHDLAARCARANHVVHGSRRDPGPSLAVPVFGFPRANQDRPPLAVLILGFPPEIGSDLDKIPGRLVSFLTSIWPICAYADLRHHFPLLSPAVEFNRFPLADTLDQVLEAICTDLGFGFATISLVDEDRREIRTVRGRNVPEAWLNDAHHPLDSDDIQAYVVRTGKTQVVTRLNKHLDKAIWTRFSHKNLQRVFVPLGSIGTIEAGFHKCERRELEKLLVRILERFAYDVTIRVQNALLADRYQAERLQNQLLEALHEVSYELQTGVREQDTLLTQIACAARRVLQADIVMLYPVERYDPELPGNSRFGAPVGDGVILGSERWQVKPANDPNNVVRHIASTLQGLYEPHAQSNPLLGWFGDPARPTTHSAKHKRRPVARSFTIRQQIQSFAGVPLLVRGKLLGVLCVNYRPHHHFSEQERQIITLFSQQAAAALVSDQLARREERSRLELALHDMVKSKISALMLLNGRVEDEVRARADAESERAVELLRIARKAGDETLFYLELILENLAMTDDGELSLRDGILRLIRQALPGPPHLTYDVDASLPALPLRSTLSLLYLLSQAVSNALQHAQAQSIHVSARYDAHQLVLTVSDDGKGFDPAEHDDRRPHRGLSGMRARVQQFRGALTVESTIGKGTTLCATIPLV